MTGSWPLKVIREAARLIEAEYVNVALASRKANNGKFGKLPEEGR